MSDIHLIKASQAIPILNTLEHIGAPVERLSSKSKMPLDVVRSKQGVIGEFSLWRFIELSAKSEGYSNLGYDCAQSNPIRTVGELGGFRMRMAPTLKVILENFISDIRAECTSTFYSLRHDNDATWFHRLQPYGKQLASWQAEQYIVTAIIQIIRICAGTDWLPTHINISSTDSPLPLPEEWSEINVSWGCIATEIKIPDTVLALPPESLQYSNQNHFCDEIDFPGSAPSFVDLIETQIRSGRINLDHTVEELGISKSTLKRRLGRMNTSYREVSEQVRFELARQMLVNTEAPVTEIAIDLGYEYPANFSRAFKRVSGMSPNKFRSMMDRLLY